LIEKLEYGEDWVLRGHLIAPKPSVSGAVLNMIHANQDDADQDDDTWCEFPSEGALSRASRKGFRSFISLDILLSWIEKERSFLLSSTKLVVRMTNVSELVIGDAHLRKTDNVLLSKFLDENFPVVLTRLLLSYHAVKPSLSDIRMILHTVCSGKSDHLPPLRPE
jgi:hypothetical protein